MRSYKRELNVVLHPENLVQLELSNHLGWMRGEVFDEDIEIFRRAKGVCVETSGGSRTCR